MSMKKVKWTVLLFPQAAEIKEDLVSEWPAGQVVSAALIVFNQLDWLTQKAIIRAVKAEKPVSIDAFEAQFRARVFRCLQELQGNEETKEAARKATS